MISLKDQNQSWIKALLVVFSVFIKTEIYLGDLATAIETKENAV